MNRELKERLARAFGLVSGSDVDGLIEDLRAEKPLDALALRRGCLALLEHVTRPRALQDEHLQSALEAASIGLWDWELTTGKIFVDRNILRFLGLDQRLQEVPIEAVMGLVHEEDRPAFSQATRDALRGAAATFQICHRARHADGRWVWIETHGNVTERDAAGRALRMTGTHADITARKQIERALSNTLRVMHALLEHMPLPVVIRDNDRRITLVNAAWEQMIGVSRDEVIGKLLTAVPKGPAIPGHRESDDHVFATRKPLRYETIVRDKDGAAYNVIVAKTPLFAEDGTLTGIASVVTDITDQKRSTAMLERARMSAEAAVLAKSRFLANMSHELRTPLNGVVGMASLLETTTLDARQRRFVRTLRTSAEALITLINDVLDLSKAEAGKLEITHGPVELRRELEQVVGLFSAPAYDKGIDIAAHIAPDVPATLRGDAIRLRQVLGNLVNNAVKFTESGAVLLAVARAADRGGDPMIEFSVTDTGVGIAPEEQKRIFEAFEQADGSVTRRFGGTGLGLAISRQLVELMNGHMNLESEPQQGSRFSFVIPAGMAPVESSRPEPAGDLGVLIIGVHPVIGKALVETLSGLSTSVTTLKTPAEAPDALRMLEPRIKRLRIYVDSVAIGDLDQVAGALRAASGSRPVEVIALMPPDADTTPPASVTRCVIKPFCTQDLLAAHSSADIALSTRVRALPSQGSRGRALVVEDNAVNQEMARAMLDMLGFDVVTASNGREGVAAAIAEPAFVVILMDCQMPVMDGLAASRAIRAAEQDGRHVPIIALTGNAMPGDREACVAAGMDDYLAKPFSLTALRKVLDRWAGAGSAASSAANSA